MHSWNSKRFLPFPVKNCFVFLQWPSCLSSTPKYLMRVLPVHLFFSEVHMSFYHCKMCFLLLSKVWTLFRNTGHHHSLFMPFWDSSEEHCWIFSRIRFPFGDYTKAWFNDIWHFSCYIYHSKSLLRVVERKKGESFLLLCSKDVWYFWIQAYNI